MMPTIVQSAGLISSCWLYYIVTCKAKLTQVESKLVEQKPVRVPTGLGIIMLLWCHKLSWLTWALAGMGLYDDWSKILYNGGIGRTSKFLIQLIILTLCMLYGHWTLWQVLFIMTIAAAVNIADGIDGLAAVPLAMSFAYYGRYDLSIVLLLYLICNNPFKPVYRMFMGDSGALGFGCILGELMLGSTVSTILLTSSTFMIALITTSLQIISLRLARRRIFPIAPIHHYFARRYGKPMTVLGYWLLHGACCAVAFSATCSACSLTVI